MSVVSIVRAPILPADLSEAPLRVLAHSDHLESRKVADCVLANLDAKAVSIEGVVFENDEISSCKLRKSSLSDVIFSNCLLFGTDFDGSGWLRITLSGGMASGLVVSDTTIQDASFNSTKLNLANFRMSTLKRVIFVDCDLSDADFQSAVMVDVEFKNCNLAGVEFSNCKMNKVDMRSSNVSTIKGASSLRGVKITSDQMISIAHIMAAELGINVQD